MRSFLDREWWPILLIAGRIGVALGGLMWWTSGEFGVGLGCFVVATIGLALFIAVLDFLNE